MSGCAVDSGGARIARVGLAVRGRFGIVMAALLLSLGGLVFGTSPARAAFIDLTPSADVIQVGGSFDLDVVVSGLPGDEIVSAFDLDLLFDPGVLSFSGIAFGSGFGTPDDYFADAFDFGAVVDFFLFVFALGDDELFILQGGGPVTLATLSFTGIAAGTSSLAIDIDDPWLDVGGRDGMPLAISAFGNARVVVEAVSVPEPSTFALLALGLGLLGIRRRVRRLA